MTLAEVERVCLLAHPTFAAAPLWQTGHGAQEAASVETVFSTTSEINLVRATGILVRSDYFRHQDGLIIGSHWDGRGLHGTMPDDLVTGFGVSAAV